MVRRVLGVLANLGNLEEAQRSGSTLIASYAQGAILLSIVGQELHDHQSPGLPEQDKQ